MIQGTKEWLEMRKTKIGASDAPAIMEKSPWKTPYKLWLEKMGIEEQEMTEQMRYGIENEPIARRAFEEKMGIMVEPDVIFNSRYPWMVASLDGIDPSRTKILEIKCCGKTDHEEAENGRVPEKYSWQLTHQMIVCELSECFYYSYHRGDGICVNYKFDQQKANDLIEKEKEFFRCMEEFEPPKMTERDYVQREDEEWLSKASEWISVHRQVLNLGILESVLRKDLIAMAGKSSSQGGGVRVCKSVRQGGIDYKAIERELEISLDKYRKEKTESWRVTDDRTT